MVHLQEPVKSVCTSGETIGSHSCPFWICLQIGQLWSCLCWGIHVVLFLIKDKDQSSQWGLLLHREERTHSCFDPAWILHRILPFSPTGSNTGFCPGCLYPLHPSLLKANCGICYVPPLPAIACQPWKAIYILIPHAFFVLRYVWGQ